MKTYKRRRAHATCFVNMTDTARAWLYQSVQKFVLKCGSNEPNIQIKLIVSQKYCMNEMTVIGRFLGSDSFDPNIWVLLPFLDLNIRTEIYKRRSHHVTCFGKHGWHSQVSLTYSYNLHLGIMIQISEWGWIPKRWFNTRFTSQILVLHIRVKMCFQVDPHFGVQWLI